MTEEVLLEYFRSINQRNSGAEYNNLLAEMIWNGAEESDVIEEVFNQKQTYYEDLVLRNEVEEEILSEAKRQIYEGKFAFKEIKDTLDAPVLPDTDEFTDEKICAYAITRYCLRLPNAIEKELVLRSSAVRNMYSIKENTSELMNSVSKFRFFNIETPAQQALKIASSQIIEALVWEITLSNNNPANPNRDPDFDPAKLREKADSNNLACMFAEAYEVSSDRDEFMQRYSETMKDLKALYAQNTVTLLDRAEAVMDTIENVVDKTVGKIVDKAIDTMFIQHTEAVQKASELSDKISDITIVVADKGIKAFKVAYETIVPKNFIDSLDRMTTQIADKILEHTNSLPNSIKNWSSSTSERTKNKSLKGVLQVCANKIEQAKSAFQSNNFEKSAFKTALHSQNSLESIRAIRDKMAETQFSEHKGPFKEFIKSVKQGTEAIGKAVTACLEIMEAQKEERNQPRTSRTRQNTAQLRS